ncbi:hypothetical protein GCM10010178_69020 [Lentzea flava]|uniref:Uncharacterized protein n=1 Tax=Lentzea flava TaxID=103732 RepID=A0ABQ2V3X7_9PSEU|nr:hypothetical protein GCM10010178_69020 [Lentzea flava]
MNFAARLPLNPPCGAATAERLAEHTAKIRTESQPGHGNTAVASIQLLRADVSQVGPGRQNPFELLRHMSTVTWPRRNAAVPP